MKAKKEPKLIFNQAQWKSLKLQFLNSPPEESLAKFLQDRFGKDKAGNGNVLKATAGWSKDRNDLYDEALEKAGRALIKEHERTVKELYGQSLEIVRKSMQALSRKTDPHPDHAKKMWEIGRTEAGLPTRINENIDFGEDKIDPAEIIKRLRNESNPSQKNKGGGVPKRKRGA